MRRFLLVWHVLVVGISGGVVAQTPGPALDAGDPEVLFDDNRTPTVSEAAALLRTLADASPDLHWMEIGTGDSGKPIHAAVLATGAAKNLDSPEALEAYLRARPKAMRLLVTNAIHPGEPDGVDASIAWIRDLLNDPAERPLLEELVVAIVPHYNNDGALVRTSCSRANQDGPEFYGFRSMRATSISTGTSRRWTPAMHLRSCGCSGLWIRMCTSTPTRQMGPITCTP